MTQHALVDSPIGELTLVASDGALTHVLMDAARYRPDAAHLGSRVPDLSGVLGEAAEQLEEYFAGTRREFDLALAPRGEAFQQRVWRLLQEIPYGTSTTYGALAARLGDPNLAQAVGSANGHNPIAIIIPCHRVVGADGSLVGYAGGLDRKRFLLALEEPAAQDVGRLF